jgi:hypothetical protein
MILSFFHLTHSNHSSFSYVGIAALKILFSRFLPHIFCLFETFTNLNPKSLMWWREKNYLSRQKKLLIFEVDACAAGTKVIEDGADADGITARRRVRPWEWACLKCGHSGNVKALKIRIYSQLRVCSFLMGGHPMPEVGCLPWRSGLDENLNSAYEFHRKFPTFQTTDSELHRHLLVNSTVRKTGIVTRVVTRTPMGSHALYLEGSHPQLANQPAYWSGRSHGNL